MPITTTTQSNTFNINPVSATDHYTGFLCSTSTYNLLGTTADSFTNLETISDSISTLSARTSYTSITTNSLVDKEIHSIFNCMEYGGKMVISGTTAGLALSSAKISEVIAEDASRYSEVISVAKVRLNCNAIIGSDRDESGNYANPDQASIISSVSTQLGSTGTTAISYLASTIIGYKERPRFYTGSSSSTSAITIFLVSDAAGANARASAQSKPYLTSAGVYRGELLNYTNVIPKLSFTSSTTLASRGINYFNYLQSKGKYYLWGDETGFRDSTSAKSSYGFSKAFLYINREVTSILDDYVFEFNDATTRSAIKSKMQNILDPMISNGSLVSYTLICDETNNPQTVINQRQLKVDLTIVPNLPVNSITLSFRISLLS
jgi:hypothetical protein